MMGPAPIDRETQLLLVTGRRPTGLAIRRPIVTERVPTRPETSLRLAMDEAATSPEIP